MNKKDTSWGKVACWYDELLENKDGAYQKEVILPNLLRLLSPQKDEIILDIEYHIASADNLSYAKDSIADKAILILALQNIENISGTFNEIYRTLKPKGKLYIVLNHPAFRIPKNSSWQWDEENHRQYRRIDSYTIIFQTFNKSRILDWKI